MTIKPASVIYGADQKPPLHITIFLAIQHCLLNSTSLLFPAIVVMAAMGNNPLVAHQITQATLLAMGIGSILMMFRRRWLGCGYLCPPIAEPAYLGIAILAVKMGGPELLFGMGLVAGFGEMIIGFCSQWARKLLPTEVTGVVVIMIGVNLIIPTLQSSFHFSDVAHFVWVPRDIWLYVITLSILLITSVWGGKKFCFYSILAAAVIGYIVAIAMGEFSATSLTTLKQAPMFSLPDFHYLGHVKFCTFLILPFLIGALCTAIKAMGNITTSQISDDAEWVSPQMSSIRSGIFTESLMTVFSSLMGGLPMGSSSSNVGYARATGVLSRYIGYFIGILFLIIAFVPKISYVLVLMPPPVRGALLTYVICYMIMAGLQIVVSRMMDERKTLVIGLSLTLGLSVAFVPGLVTAVPAVWQPVLGSPLTVATITAFILNMLFRIGIAKKVTHIINLKQPFNQKILELLQKQGKTWGAFPRVMQTASEAIPECLQLIQSLSVEEVKMILTFDEYNLKINIYYKGPQLHLGAVLKSRVPNTRVKSKQGQINVKMLIKST